MTFYKYVGVGNDFIITNQEVEIKDVPKLCDRNFGIGADGVIVDRIVDGVPFMQIYNADGSIATMCGNGIRCYAKYLDDNNRDFSHIKTLAGDKYIDKIEENIYKVNMGKPIIDFEDKELIKGRLVDACYTGVHHLTFFDEKHELDEKFLNENISLEEDGNLFPEGTNLNIVRVNDRKNIQIMTHERGVGITLACGTGSCASAYMAFKKGYVDNNLRVGVLSGHLDIEIKDDTTIFMIGEAKKVFSGEIEL